MKRLVRSIASFARQDDPTRYERRLEACERRLKRMRKRWPIIAEAADHPLTVATAAWRPQRSLRTVGVEVGRALLGWGSLAIIPLTLAQGATVFLPTVAVFVVALTVLQPRSRGHSTVELEKQFRPGSKALWQDLWLTPLTYRQIAGIVAGRAWLRRPIWQRAAMIAFWAVPGCWVFLWSGILPFARWHWRFIIGAIVLLVSFWSCSDDFLLHAAFSTLRRNLETARQRKKYPIGFFVARLFVALAVLISLALAVGSLAYWIGNSETIRTLWSSPISFAASAWRLPRWASLGGLFLVVAALWRLARRALPKWTEARFKAQTRRGQASYEEYVRFLAEE